MPLRTWRFLILSMLPLAFNGCALWHEMQPHRLHRLNRVPAPHLDPEFSQADKKAETRLVNFPKQTSLFLRVGSDHWPYAAAAVDF